jgi:ABC-type branched-subunit amino acid transport system ATPase component
MLDVRSLRKAFDGFIAVNCVSLAVARGEIAAVIGPNGAGKSTKKTGKKFFSLSFKPKQERIDRGQSLSVDLGDEIPFAPEWR